MSAHFDSSGLDSGKILQNSHVIVIIIINTTTIIMPSDGAYSVAVSTIRCHPSSSKLCSSWLCGPRLCRKKYFSMGLGQVVLSIPDGLFQCLGGLWVAAQSSRNVIHYWVGCCDLPEHFQSLVLQRCDIGRFLVSCRIVEVCDILGVLWHAQQPT